MGLRDAYQAPRVGWGECGPVGSGSWTLGDSGAGGVQTAKASRKQSSLSGKESAQGCIPKRLRTRLKRLSSSSNSFIMAVFP